MNKTNFFEREQTYTIAEVGNNHLGQFDLAVKHIEALKGSGVDAIKFQMFKPEELVSKTVEVYKHVPDRSIKYQRDRFRKMVLSKEEFAKLAIISKEAGFDFLCTPFDKESADFLDELIPVFKIASGDSSNFSLIEHVIEKGKPVMVSTGLCDQKEVDMIAEILPKDQSLLFHCIGSYPTPDNDVNLANIPFYKDRYQLPIGFSDHTSDILAPVTAVAMGAAAIEKHYILDDTIPGGDKTLSLTPEQMTKMVSEIRRVEKMIGTGGRSVYESEVYGKKALRRSAYSRSAQKQGDVLDLKDIVFLRPEESNGHDIRDVYRNKKIEILRDIGEEEVLTPENSRFL